MFICKLLNNFLNDVPLKYKCYNLCNCGYKYAQYRRIKIIGVRYISNKVEVDKGVVQDERVRSCINRLSTFYCTLVDSDNLKELIAFKSTIPFYRLLDQFSALTIEKKELKAMKRDSNDIEIHSMVDSDLAQISDQEQLFESKILSALPAIFEDGWRSDVIVEISPGVGGQEAMLFANEILDMYKNYCYYSRWSVEEEYESSSGGIRRGTLVVNGNGCYRQLKFESGIHRVQRTPKTERMGRVHTSTVSVAILPVPSEIEIEIKDSDIRIDTMRASGAGGQHVNTTDSAIRITHIPSGTVVECQENRSQQANRKIAYSKLRSKLYQVKLDEQDSRLKSNRKLQVGTKGRSEKIRTYNYNQDRITDHRIPVTLHNVLSMLSGQELLEKLIKRLEDENNVEMLIDLVDSYVKDPK